MAGIDTHADAGLILNAVDDRRQMLKLKAKIAALPSGILNHRRNPFGLRQGDIDRLSNARQTLVFLNL
ncbi:hypothetical protein D3C80_2131170 [compost metagenome]